MIILIIIIVLVFGVGGGYLGHNRWGSTNQYAGPGIGIGTILVILLICWALGLFGRAF
jgi:TRAP-type C4-dicarboxylate transport system permease small subunit